MKVVEAAQIGSNSIFGAPRQDFPFTFGAAYSRLVFSAGDDLVFLQHAAFEASAPIRLYRQRVIRCGQWLSPPMRGGRLLTPSEELDFIEEANLLMRDIGVNRLIQPPNHALFQATPKTSRHCRFGTYLLKLENRSESEIFAGMHQLHRRNIRSAIRDGVIIRRGHDQIPTFHQLLTETMQRSSLTFPSLEELQALSTALGPEGCACIVAYSPCGAPQGGLMAPITRKGAYYLHGGSVARPRIKGAIKAAHWELIRSCINNGVRQYNFVGARLSDVSGTKLERIQSFKAGFGGVLREGYLWKMDLSPMLTSAYDSANWFRKKYLRRATCDGISHLDIIDQELQRSVESQR